MVYTGCLPFAHLDFRFPPGSMPSETDLPGQVLVRPLALWFLVKFCQRESSARIRVHAGYLSPDTALLRSCKWNAALYWQPSPYDFLSQCGSCSPLHYSKSKGGSGSFIYIFVLPKSCSSLCKEL